MDMRKIQRYNFASACYIHRRRSTDDVKFRVEILREMTMTTKVRFCFGRRVASLTQSYIYIYMFVIIILNIASNIEFRRN